ncbi:hypothetical protein L9F63_018029, partial [Diploptera punctata]
IKTKTVSFSYSEVSVHESRRKQEEEIPDRLKIKEKNSLKVVLEKIHYIRYNACLQGKPRARRVGFVRKGKIPLERHEKRRNTRHIA